VLRFHWTDAEIADRTRRELTRDDPARRRCAGIRDLFALVETKIAEDETGWTAPD